MHIRTTSALAILLLAGACTAQPAPTDTDASSKSALKAALESTTAQSSFTSSINDTPITDRYFITFKVAPLTGTYRESETVARGTFLVNLPQSGAQGYDFAGGDIDQPTPPKGQGLLVNEIHEPEQFKAHVDVTAMNDQIQLQGWVYYRRGSQELRSPISVKIPAHRRDQLVQAVAGDHAHQIELQTQLDAY
ncbi:MAG TPA: hypothetical protein VGU69_10555 [Rhizomicrobium sp.]|nr:hypothetical protein [Rhizomicrobium sp.]